MYRSLLRLVVIAILIAGCARQGRTPGPMMDPGMMDRHMAPIPAKYAGLSNPVAANPDTLGRGQALNCLKCERGTGNISSHGDTMMQESLCY